MKIIAISVRRKHITALKLEDGTELLLDSDIVAEKALKPGGFIADPDALLYESDLKRAKSRALWYLSRGDHSRHALTEKLINGGFSKEAAAAAVERMEELSLIDDQRYAAHLCQILSSSGVSKKELYYKLINKGISSELAKNTVEEIEGEESEKILGLLKTKYSSKLDCEENIQKVFATLVRKGFSYYDIKDAFKAYNEEIECEEDN